MLIPAIVTFTMADDTVIRWLCFSANATRPDGTAIVDAAGIRQLLIDSPSPNAIAVLIGDEESDIDSMFGKESADPQQDTDESDRPGEPHEPHGPERRP